MKKNRMKFLIIEFLLLLLAVFFVWKIFDQNVAEPRIAVILPESGDKRWDSVFRRDFLIDHICLHRLFSAILQCDIISGLAGPDS